LALAIGVATGAGAGTVTAGAEEGGVADVAAFAVSGDAGVSLGVQATARQRESGIMASDFMEGS
jgi:hypothetical protein